MIRRKPDLARVVSRQARALTTEHAASLQGIGDPADLRRSLSRLVDAGLIVVRPFTAALVEPGPAPLLTWSPGEPEPGFGPVLWAAARRARSDEARTHRILLATRRCGNLYGVRRTGALARPLQLVHDLACAGVLVRLYRQCPDEAEGWAGEDAADFRLDGKVPDAVILADREVRRAIEIVGPHYRAEKLAALWRGAAREGVPLELW